MTNNEQPTASGELSNENRRISNLRTQSFEDAYSVHDVGETLVCDRLLDFNLQAFKHGDDKRDEDAVYSGTGVDLGVEMADAQTRAYRDPSLNSGPVGWIEVKTKKDLEWMGRLNKSHWEEYRGFATYREEPVFVFFCHVKDVEYSDVGERYFVRVPPSNESDTATTLPFTSKGHEIVEVESERLDWSSVLGVMSPFDFD